MAGTLTRDRDEAPHQRVRRTIALIALSTLALLALLARLAYVQLVQGEYFGRLADLNQLRTIPVAAPRGVLFDRHGVVIARNRPSFVVQMVPMQVRDPQQEIAALSQMLGIPNDALWRRLLRQNGVTYSDFDALANAIPLGPINIAHDLTPAEVGTFSERSERFPGMSVELVPVRDYPHRTLGSHFLGYVGQITETEYAVRKAHGYGANDIVGKEGLEFTYDSWLRGRSGGRRIKVNSAGEAVANMGDFAAIPGNDLLLTID